MPPYETQEVASNGRRWLFKKIFLPKSFALRGLVWGLSFVAFPNILFFISVAELLSWSLNSPYMIPLNIIEGIFGYQLIYTRGAFLTFEHPTALGFFVLLAIYGLLGLLLGLLWRAIKKNPLATILTAGVIVGLLFYLYPKSPLQLSQKSRYGIIATDCNYVFDGPNIQNRSICYAAMAENNPEITDYSFCSVIPLSSEEELKIFCRDPRSHNKECKALNLEINYNKCVEAIALRNKDSLGCERIRPDPKSYADTGWSKEQCYEKLSLISLDPQLCKKASTKYQQQRDCYVDIIKKAIGVDCLAHPLTSPGSCDSAAANKYLLVTSCDSLASEALRDACYYSVVYSHQYRAGDSFPLADDLVTCGKIKGALREECLDLRGYEDEYISFTLPRYVFGVRKPLDIKKCESEVDILPMDYKDVIYAGIAFCSNTMSSTTSEQGEMVILGGRTYVKTLLEPKYLRKYQYESVVGKYKISAWFRESSGDAALPTLEKALSTLEVK